MRELFDAVDLPVPVHVESMEHYGEVPALLVVAGKHLLRHVGQPYHGGLGRRSGESGGDYADLSCVPRVPDLREDRVEL